MKTLTINDLEKEGVKSPNPVWVLNSSMDSEVQTQGDVLLVISKRSGTGDPDKIVIPATWLPCNMTKDVSRAQLITSTEFRKAVSKKLITIIDDKTARKLLASEDAEEEQRRLDAEARHVIESTGARAISAVVTLVEGEGDTDAPAAEEKKALISVLASGDEHAEEDGISTQFQMFADKLTLVSDVEAANLIRTRRKFTQKELKYLKKIVKGPKCLAIINANIDREKK